MKFFPTNINLNANTPCSNLKSKITPSSTPQFFDHLNFVFTKPPQKASLLEKDVSNNQILLTFIFLFLIISNEKISQNNLLNNKKSAQLTELNKKFSPELSNLSKLFEKRIENNSELKKLIIKLQQYLQIDEYNKIGEGNIENILTRFYKTIFESGRKKEIISNIQKIYDSTNLDKMVNKLYKQLGLDENNRKVENSNEAEFKKINQLIKDINEYMKDNSPKLLSKISKFVKINLTNKKHINVIVKLDLDTTKLKNSLIEDNLKLIIEKIDNINEQIKNISQYISYPNKKGKYLDLKNIKNQIVELQKKLFNITEENRGLLEKGQIQKTIEQIVHNIGSLKDRFDRMKGELLKMDMENQLKKRLLDSSGIDKGFNDFNEFATGSYLRSFVLDKADQGPSSTVDSKFRDEIFRQIEMGIFKNLGEGRREVSIKLHPPELGLLKVVMQVNNKEVSMVLHTEYKDIADALNRHIANFEKSFEQQGLKIVKLEVKNDLFSGGENSLKNFTGSRNHAQKNNNGFKRRHFVGLGLEGEENISAIAHKTIQSFQGMDSGFLYVVV